MKTICRLWILVSIVPILSAVGFAGSTPELLNYQGVLRNVVGGPEDGDFDFVFRFYNEPTCAGGTLLLSDSHAAVAVSGGLFDVELGGGSLSAGASATLAEVFRDNVEVWLEIEVNEETLCPRVRVESAAYALNADHLDGRDASGFLDTSPTPQTKLGQLTLRKDSGDGDNLLRLEDGVNGNGMFIGTDNDLTGFIRMRPLDDTGGIAITNTGDDVGLFVAGTAQDVQPPVGIGTYTPSEALDVVGNIKATGDITTAATFNGDGSGLTGVLAANAALLDGNASAFFLDTSADPQTKAGPLILWPGGSSFRSVRFEDSADMLVLESGDDAALTIDAANASKEASTLYAHGGVTQWFTGMDSHPTSAQGDFVIKRADGGEPDLVVDNETGDVAIGMRISASARLHVVGPDVAADLSTSSLRLTSNIGTGSEQNLLLDGNEIDSRDSMLSINDNSGHDVSLATGGGDVGIGTLTPAEKLHVQGSIRASADVIADGDLTAVGGITTAGVIESTSGGFRFPDGSILTTAARDPIGDACYGLTLTPYCNLGAAISDVVNGPTDVSEVLDESSGVGPAPSVAIGLDGLPVVSYYDFENQRLKVAHCNDTRCSTNSAVVVDSTAAVGLNNSIAIGQAGLPIIAYDDLTNDTVKIVSCTDPSCSCTDTACPPLEAADGSVGGIAIAIGQDWRPVIAFIDDTSREVRVLRCADPTCTSISSNEVVAAGANFKFDPSLAIGAGGLPIVVYYDLTLAKLQVVRCDDVDCTCDDEDCTSAQSPITIEQNGRQPSLAIGVDGLPVISYYDLTATALEVVHCEEPGCTGGSDKHWVSQVDNSADVGLDSSLAVGWDGLPVISYHDATNSNLKAVFCNDLACSDWDPPQTVDDSPQMVGLDTSLAIGAYGRPVIAHHDNVLDRLKIVTHVTNPVDAPPPSAPATAPSTGEIVELFAEDPPGGGQSGETAPETTDPPPSAWARWPIDEEGNVYANSFRPSASDLASLVTVTEPVEAGDVLVIDTERPGQMKLATTPADTAVFGIVAGDAGMVLGATPPMREVDESETPGDVEETTMDLADAEVPVSLSGVAVCKVDAGYGSIRPGDLLTTSPTPGHAMRTLEPAPGTILGKALEPLDTGTGSIRVLVMLR